MLEVADLVMNVICKSFFTFRFCAFDTVNWKVVTELIHAADRSQSHLPNRKSELKLLEQTLHAKTETEEKEEKKILDRDMDDIGEGSARGTVSRRDIWL